MIALGMPSAGVVNCITAAALAALAVRVASTHSAPMIITPTGRIEQNRNACAGAAVDYDCRYLLFLDADMNFPYDTFSRLVAHDVDIVGCNAAGRVSGKPVFPYEGEGLKGVPAIGMAVTLIRVEVFKALRRPWFISPQREEGRNDLISSDINFCNMAGAEGFQIYCDLDLSKEIGHFSTVERRLS